ncbi:MAG: YeeE/YedE thiosulfate transporter family protein, partial [Deltaproteobacteria bacterium]
MVLLILLLAIYAGIRQGILLAIGLGFGITLEGLGFGFAGPWRRAILERNTHGIQAQLLAIGLAALPSLLLLDIAAGELIGATAPVGVSMILGAFVFGIAMQVVLGCGSGTLVNAGSGNLMGLWALPFFIAGSFLGTLHLPEWHALGHLEPIALSDWLGTSGAILLT